jgi:hypothetical protein
MSVNFLSVYKTRFTALTVPETRSAEFDKRRFIYCTVVSMRFDRIQTKLLVFARLRFFFLVVGLLESVMY